MNAREFRCHPAWRYRWLHIPTGTQGLRALDEDIDRDAFLALVNRWNAQQPGRWQYWATSEEA